MPRNTVDHRKGKGGRDAALVDEHGGIALRLNGSWAVSDDAGRTQLFLSPDPGAIARASAVGGLMAGSWALTTRSSYSPTRGEDV